MRTRFALLAGILTFAACNDGVAPTLRPERVAGEVAGILAPNGPLPIEVAAGASFACGRMIASGDIRCWGANGVGQAPAVKAPSTGTFVQVAAGSFHACGLRSDGVVECWGENVVGQAPATVTAASGVFVRIGLGMNYGCGIRDDGALECWGQNNLGQAPVVRQHPTIPYTRVAMFDGASCALRADGVIECFGDDSEGRAPASVAPPNGVFKDVAMGEFHGCGLRGNGDVHCWGDDSFGQAPAKRRASSGRFTRLVASKAHTCALRDDGVVECWGNNDAGQAPPIRTATRGGYRAISTHETTTCGLRNDRIPECWGNETEDVHIPPFALRYRFDGPFGSWKDASYPAMNSLRLPSVGRTLYVAFTLRGDEGMDILADGSPRVAAVDCENPGEPAFGSAAVGALSYASDTDRYTYAWQVPGAYAGSCRQLMLGLDDGSVHRVNFRFTGSPSVLDVGSGDGQSARGGEAVGPVELVVRDAEGMGVAGVPVHFEVLSGGGSVAGATAVSGPDGTVTAPTWTLGKYVLPQTLRATFTRGTDVVSTVVNATVQTSFNIEVRFYSTEMDPLYQDIFTTAAARLSAIITGDVPDLAVANLDMSSCASGVASLTETIDDIVIYAAVDEIDGPSQVLASAGPCYIRNPGSLPLVGRMRFDVADIANMYAAGVLEDVIMHEMLHVLGVGSIWGALGLRLNAGTADPRYVGAQGIAGCVAVGGTVTCGTDVPLENTGGAGTAGSHWRETTFDNELMTGFVEALLGMPISQLTVGGLADLGYTVNASAKDAYTIPGGMMRRGASPPEIHGWEQVTTEPVPIGPDGRVGRRIPRDR